LIDSWSGSMPPPLVIATRSRCQLEKS
jgi:hypothetical protein